jgi:hypothetical protein
MQRTVTRKVACVAGFGPVGFLAEPFRHVVAFLISTNACSDGLHRDQRRLPTPQRFALQLQAATCAAIMAGYVNILLRDDVEELDVGALVCHSMTLNWVISL